MRDITYIVLKAPLNSNQPTNRLNLEIYNSWLYVPVMSKFRTQFDEIADCDLIRLRVIILLVCGVAVAHKCSTCYSNSVTLLIDVAI